MSRSLTRFSRLLRPAPTPSRRRAAAWRCAAPWLLLAACAPAGAPSGELALRDAEWSSDAPAFVSLGESTTCITTEDGEAKCWGRGDGGRLGLGTTVAESESEPAAIEPLALGGPATMIATNGAQSYALLADGRVRAFGLNGAYELGLGHAQAVGDDETPTGADVPTIMALDGLAKQLAVGRGFACARLEDARVQCWGRGDAGQLGGGPQSGPQRPMDVPLGGDAVEIAAGAAHACARLASGAIRCWGDGDDGRLGYGHEIDDGATPLRNGDVPLGGTAVRLAAGEAHTCALLESGAVRCWGRGDDGRLGYGGVETIGDDEPPSSAGDVALGGPAMQLVAGRRHTCALRSDGVLRCWGNGSHGQLGLEPSQSIGDDERPLDAPALDTGGLGVAAIFAGALAEHTCAQLDDGALRCWGRNEHGQVGLAFVSPQDPVEGPPGDLPDVIIVEDPDA
jgi:alpha-tubulin suppressor-like RCC1 family protein